MWNLIQHRLGKAPLFAAAALLLTPALASAQLREIPSVYPSQFAGYSPYAYSGYATIGPPSYLTSINYPTIYGNRTYGSSWAGPYMSSALKTPFTTYPETYNPVAPPLAAGYSQLYYRTGPGGSPAPTAPAVSNPSLTTPSEASLATSSSVAPATIDITVPEDAEIIIQNKKVALTGTGSIRRYTTPFLNPGAVYSYDVTARWSENGKDMTRTQRVLVRPGEAESVSFMSGTSTLQSTGELPR